MLDQMASVLLFMLKRKTYYLYVIFITFEVYFKLTLDIIFNIKCSSKVYKVMLYYSLWIFSNAVSDISFIK